jgi:serine/threonine protein kinase
MKRLSNLGFLKGANGKENKQLVKNKQLVEAMHLEEAQILSEERITLGGLLGQGGFAKVYKCELDGQTAVAKIIDSDKINDEMTYLLTNECTIWARLSHPNIVSFYGMASTANSLFLVCEFFPGGSLLERNQQLRRSKAAPPTMGYVVDELLQIASGMEYLHALEPPVLHRDLKSANILLAEGGRRMAIADFGLARYQADDKKMTAETGSYRWMAPEVIRHEAYNSACDVYSFAILTWEMLTYRVPFENMMPVEAAFAVAKGAKRPPIPERCEGTPIQQMLEVCWDQQAKNRPSFAELKVALDAEAGLIAEAATADAPDAPTPMS